MRTVSPQAGAPRSGPQETTLPEAAENRPVDPRLTRALSALLRVGLLLAVGLMIVGAILAAVRGHGSVDDSSSVGRLPHLLAAGDPTGFLELGLLVLLITPAARVVALLAFYAGRRQWLFAGISLVVIIVLALSAYLGLSLA